MSSPPNMIKLLMHKADITCTLCSSIPCSEVFTCENGHIACHLCRAKGVLNCSVCQKVTTRNRYAEKSLDEMIVGCPFNGCETKLKHLHMKDHMDKCQFQPRKERLPPQNDPSGGLLGILRDNLMNEVGAVLEDIGPMIATLERASSTFSGLRSSIERADIPETIESLSVAILRQMIVDELHAVVNGIGPIIATLQADNTSLSAMRDVVQMTLVPRRRPIAIARRHIFRLDVVSQAIANAQAFVAEDNTADGGSESGEESDDEDENDSPAKIPRNSEHGHYFDDDDEEE